MYYIFLSVLLVIVLSIYIRIADKFNIIDKPNSRSSHSKITVRGGGIIFPVAILIWFISYGFHYPMFFAGLVMISLVSFIDDISPLSNRIRIAIQFASILLLFSELGFHLLPWWIWVIIWIISTGTINAFNFMDGINGITASYSLSVLLGVWLVNNYQVEFIPNELIYSTGISLLVFSFYNFRKKAICFAGDIGSVSIAFILVFILAKLIIQTNNLLYILFLSIYGVDTITTIIYRLWQRENIFEAHRKHVYQLLANELKLSQIFVAIAFASLQLLICTIVYLTINKNYTNTTTLIFGLSSLAIMALLFGGARYKINAYQAKQKAQITV